jgi:alpha-galactosidase
MRLAIERLGGMHLCRKRPSCTVMAAILALACVHGLALPRKAELATSDVRVSLRFGEQAPFLQAFTGQACGGTWNNIAPEQLPAAVNTGGVQRAVRWRLNQTLSSVTATRIETVYETEAPRLRLHSVWQARVSFGALEHFTVVENLSGDEVWLPLVDSLAMQLSVPGVDPLHLLYIEKGGGAPTAEGTHDEAVRDGFKWVGNSSTYANPAEGQPQEIIPAEIVYSPGAKQCGWYAGIEFSGRTRIAFERSGDRLHSVLGLDPEPGPFRTRLVPGGSFTTPTVFLGAFTGGPDGAGNQLRTWVRAALGNPEAWKNAQYPLTVNNSWGSGMQVDEPLALRMIAESKELGLEMFHVDAGWFRGVGDWYPDPKKFPHGLGAIADAAHNSGLRFGIWVDWTQAALDTEPGALNVHDPKVRNWLVADVGPEWKPEEFKGQTIDIGVPAASEYAAREVKRIIESYHLDMLEHDGYLVAQGCTRDNHPHAPPNRSTMKAAPGSGGDLVHASNSTDVSYHAVRAYYDIQEKARREHPGLLLEICNDGGRMVDFGTAAHGDYFSITDSYDPLSNRRAFYDASHLLPAAMLESYVEKWPAPALANFLYMLRSGMMGWVTIMLDTTAWTPEQHEAARDAIALYKQQLRPLIRDAELYHISERPDGVHWDGVQYWDAKRGQGVVFAFRGTTEENMHRFRLAGLDAGKSYRLHFADATQPDRIATGHELMEQGLNVALNAPLSSELVFLSAPPDAGHNQRKEGGKTTHAR